MVGEEGGRGGRAGEQEVRMERAAAAEVTAAAARLEERGGGGGVRRARILAPKLSHAWPGRNFELTEQFCFYSRCLP